MRPKEVANKDRVLALIDTLSSTLSNFDAEFQYQVAHVHSTVEPDLRPVILSTVQRRHLQRREPYVQQIAELRKQVGTR